MKERMKTESLEMPKMNEFLIPSGSTQFSYTSWDSSIGRGQYDIHIDNDNLIHTYDVTLKNSLNYVVRTWLYMCKFLSLC